MKVVKIRRYIRAVNILAAHAHKCPRETGDIDKPSALFRGLAARRQFLKSFE
jgi:hypothetical protein